MNEGLNLELEVTPTASIESGERAATPSLEAALAADERVLPEPWPAAEPEPAAAPDPHALERKASPASPPAPARNRAARSPMSANAAKRARRTANKRAREQAAQAAVAQPAAQRPRPAATAPAAQPAAQRSRTAAAAPAAPARAAATQRPPQHAQRPQPPATSAQQQRRQTSVSAPVQASIPTSCRWLGGHSHPQQPQRSAYGSAPSCWAREFQTLQAAASASNELAATQQRQIAELTREKERLQERLRSEQLAHEQTHAQRRHASVEWQRAKAKNEDALARIEQLEQQVTQLINLSRQPSSSQRLQLKPSRPSPMDLDLHSTQSALTASGLAGAVRRQQTLSSFD